MWQIGQAIFTIARRAGKLKYLLGKKLLHTSPRRVETPQPVATKRAFIAVDMANLAHMLEAAREKGLDMDYAKLLAWLSQGRCVVAARVYTGLNPTKHVISGFLRALQRLGYHVVEVHGKTYKDRSMKRPNADVFIVTDLLAAAPNYDEAILVSGDGDFTYMVQALLSMGKQVQVISTRDHLAQSLRECGAHIEYLEPHLPLLLAPRPQMARSRTG